MGFDFSAIDWPAVFNALLALASAIFGLKLYAEKTGTRIPLISKPTETERKLKLLAQADVVNERMGLCSASRHKRLVEGVEALKPPVAPPTPPSAS